uniref:Ovule protein n=1 Tax=Schistosoma curassoni TaxID=6186 RepID=A0A183K5R7_9TREM
MMQFDDLRSVCPIHFHRLFLISSSAGSWFVLSHCRLLLILSGQWMLSILRRHLFINTLNFLVVVVLQVSALYSRTALTFVLKIVTLILVESC